MNTTQAEAWWQSLEPQWQKAFNRVMLQKGATTEMPNEAGFATIFDHKFLRFAGPKAPYPNMDFELSNLSGLAVFKDAEMVSVTYHNISDLNGIKGLNKLKSLFLDNNQITNMDGIENLTELSEIYIQSNLIESLLPIQKLTDLKALYCNDNRLTSLEGLTEDHSDNLRTFICLPNDGVKQREIIRVENTLGIKCRGVN